MSQAPVHATDYQGNDKIFADATAELNRQVDEGTSWSGNERNQVFLNLGRNSDKENVARFAEISAVAGFDFPDDSRALVSLDWDHDGDLDFITTNRTAPRLRIFENRLTHRPDSFLFIKLQGSTSNRDAIGSRVELVLKSTDGPIQIHRTLRAGDGFLSQSSKWLHFGLPPETEISSLVVHWPGQEKQSFSGFTPGKSFLLTQGSTVPKEISRPSIMIPNKKAEEEPIISETSVAHLERPLPLPQIPYLDFNDEPQSITHRLNKPLVISLWATWCPDCLEELTEFSKSASAFKQAGFDVLALCVDAKDEKTRAKAQEILAQTKFPFSSGIATDKTLEVIHLSHNNVFIRPSQLPVPAAFVIAPGAKLHSVVRGPISTSELLPIFNAVNSSPDEWASFSRPAGPGPWVHGPDRIPYSGIAKDLLERDWLDDAANFLIDQKDDLIADGKIYPELLMAIGTKLLEDQQPTRGIRLLQETVNAAPHLAVARNNLAVALLQSNRADEARPHLEAALESDPNFQDARLNLARYHVGKRDFNSASSLIAPILQKGYHPKAIRIQAQILLAQSKTNELLAVFQTIAQQEPGQVSSWVNLGKLQQQLGKPAEALVSYQKAAQLAPGNPQLQAIIQQLSSKK